MIWPFKRKPKVTDIRRSTDIRAGDKVVCIYKGRWNDPQPFDPEHGDIATVVSVTDDVNQYGFRAHWLFFSWSAQHGYRADYFRKLVEQDDQEAIEAIKRAGKKVRA